MNLLHKDRWPSYLVGALIGVLLTGIFAYGYQIGVSSGIARIAALIGYGMAPSYIAPGSYFERLLSVPVIFDWKILFIIGLFLGALFASKITTETPPPKNTIWIRRFGPSKGKRFAGAFIGGFLLMLGARFADGCTSGHAISGGAQLSVVSWVFMITLFAVAIPVSYFMYQYKSREGK